MAKYSSKCEHQAGSVQVNISEVLSPLRHISRLVHCQPEVHSLHGRHFPRAEREVMKHRVVGEVHHAGLVEDEGEQVVTFRVLNKSKVGLCPVPVRMEYYEK